MAWDPGQEERGQEKRVRGDIRSRKRWDVMAERQRIENTKQRRDKSEQNGWNGQGSSLYRKDAPSEYSYAVWRGKTRMMFLPEGEQILIICLLVLT